MALHVSGAPANRSVVQALASLQEVGQSAPSQTSPLSRVPLPQVGEQSLSFASVQPGGQHPSPLPHWVTTEYTQLAVQFSPLPIKVSAVLALASSQLIGQSASQTSLISRRPLPQREEQSLSTEISQPAAQHPSLSTHEVISVKLQAALQLEALPLKVSKVQLFPSSQASGQLPSQTSPSPTTPSPPTRRSSPCPSSAARRLASTSSSPSTRTTPSTRGRRRARRSSLDPRQFRRQSEIAPRECRSEW